MDDTSSRNRKLKAILIPNLVQFIAIIVLLFVGTIYVLPLIQDVFEQVGSSMKLPDITLWDISPLNTSVFL